MMRTPLYRCGVDVANSTPSELWFGVLRVDGLADQRGATLDDMVAELRQRLAQMRAIDEVSPREPGPDMPLVEGKIVPPTILENEP